MAALRAGQAAAVIPFAAPRRRPANSLLALLAKLKRGARRATLTTIGRHLTKVLNSHVVRVRPATGFFKRGVKAEGLREWAEVLVAILLDVTDRWAAGGLRRSSRTTQ